ncbi:MAG: hypothetical protein IJU72_05005 [Bacteroidales bacterium]|nr:hypothetical protein [Bacteroidales bacterium]
MSLPTNRLRIKQLAFAQAEAAIFDRAKKKSTHLFNPDQVEFVNDQPDVLMFLTGGSERAAIECVQEFRFYLLLASREANAWASALEVKAWMAQHRISAMLVDTDDPAAPQLLCDFYHALMGVKHLRGQRLGVVGAPSDWLVASGLSPYVLRNKMGVEMVNLQWADIVFDEITAPNEQFCNAFDNVADTTELHHSSRIYEGLASLVPFYNLDALAVECFPMVRQSGHTACLALAKLNAEGIPTACEADPVSAVGMMLVHRVCGLAPWMANTAHVAQGKALFAHCTAPLNLLSSFKVDTHFETSAGQAIAGDLSGDAVTVVRLNSALDRMFVAECEVLARPHHKTACRTQLEVAISAPAYDYFMNRAYGNHHLLLPGHWANRLRLAAQLLQITVEG